MAGDRCLPGLAASLSQATAACQVNQEEGLQPSPALAAQVCPDLHALACLLAYARWWRRDDETAAAASRSFFKVK